MNIKRTDEGIVVGEALRFEMIATDLFEMPSPWLTFEAVEATVDTIDGWFTIHALNGSFRYRLTGWCRWMAHVALAELVDGPVLYQPAVTTFATTDAAPLETTSLIPKPRR